MDWLKSAELDHWWKLAAVAGAVITIASVGVKFTPGVLIGLGMLFFGSGEWSMVRRIERPFPATFGTPGGIHWIVIRERGLFGTSLQIAGVILFALGIYKLL